MPVYCLIKPHREWAGFRNFLGQLPLSPRDRAVLAGCTVKQVKVDTARREWDIMIEAGGELSPEAIALICDNLCARFGLQTARLSLQRLPAVYANLETCLLETWENIVQSAAGQAPSTKGWLVSARWYIGRDDAVHIEVPHAIGYEILRQKKCDDLLAGIILERTGRTVKVVLEVGEGISEEMENEPEPSFSLPVVRPEPTKAKTASAASRTIRGKTIKEPPIPIVSLQDEEKQVVVTGKILKVDIRDLRSGRQLVAFDLTDDTDSITAKFFVDDNEKKDYGALLQPGRYVKIKGPLQMDKFAGELTLLADHIMAEEYAERTDVAPDKRVELHLHTRMSALDAVCGIDAVIARAARWGHTAIAITDHGVVQAFPEAQECAKKYNIKIIYGVEGYLCDDVSGPSRHIILLARNNTGLKNLYHLVSLSHLEYYHRTPRIPREELVKRREGLIVGSACEAGEVIQAILRGAGDSELLEIAGFYDYLEIQPVANNLFLLREGKVASEEALRDINRKVCWLAARLNKPVVATGDVHFLDPADAVFRKILLAGQGYADAEDQAPLFFRTTGEMLAEFAYLGEALAYAAVVENPRRIAELVEVIKPIPDELYAPEIPGAEEQIVDMTYRRAKELYGDPLPPLVAERLRQELDGIINNGFAVLYLIAHKLVKKSLDDGYLVGSRGSVGSSLVATMCGITEVNPLPPHWLCPSCRHHIFVTDGSAGSGADLADRACPLCGRPMAKDGHDIPFAVFMGFHGDKVPDIDLNFSGEYQATAHKYAEELFGRDHVFRAGTIATIAERTAYGFVKGYLTERGINARTAEINRLVAGCTGVKRTTGQHPGGLMVVPRHLDIHDFTPIQYPADDKESGIITTHFDYHAISSRLVKLDILGHDDPTVIKMLQDLTGVDVRRISLDEPKTLALFSGLEPLGLDPKLLGTSVGTLGIPEFGTKFVRQMLEDTKPRTFSELVRISGFSHGTDVWLNNAQDLIKNGVAKLSEAISARDDIMVYLIHKGVEPGLAFKIMEGVRKGKGVNPDDAEVMRRHDVPEWYIESCRKIKYMFPKAHAVAYVMMAFRIAYFKVYHPLAFYASYFTVRATDFDAQLITQGETALRNKIAELERKGTGISAKEKSLLTILEVALEMNLRGFTFRKVDLYASDGTRFLIAGNSLLPPLVALQGLGENAAANIVAARQEHPFTSVEDLRVRAKASKTVIDILQEHGCLDLPLTDQIVLFG